MRNIINILFSISLVIILLITFWSFISPNQIDDRVCAQDLEPIGTSVWYPLGCDESKRDFAVYLSESFKYNIKISLLGAFIFLIVGTLIGLGKGLINDNINVKKNYFKNPLYLIKDFSDLITEIFLSIPLLLILILSVFFFQMSISNPDIRLTCTLIVLAFFSSPSLSIPLEGIINKLNKEEFILAAKASGISRSNLIFKHILYYESKGVIILQTINFFLFSIMMEIFLTFFSKGADPFQPSLGSMIKRYSVNLYDIYFSPELFYLQEKVLSFTPFIFIILLCLTIRWFGQRILIITETQ